MRVQEFIRHYCCNCDAFDWTGCPAYLDEECDEAFYHPLWHGKTMRERVDAYCDKKFPRKK